MLEEDLTGFTCDICGKRFQRRSTSHLRTHGINSWPEYEEYLRKKQSGVVVPKDLISEVAERILKGEEIPEEYIGSLAKLQKVVIDRANSLLNVAVVKRMSRLNRLLDAMNPIDERLTDPNEIRQLDFPMLLKLSEHIRVHAKELYDELRGTEAAKFGTNVSVNVQQNAQPIAPVSIPSDPRERANLVMQINRFLAAVSDGAAFNGKEVTISQ